MSMFIGIILIALIISLISLFFFQYRNNYTCDIAMRVSFIIYKYNVSNNISKKNYDDIMISYNKYMFSFWRWGIEDMIKPEYSEVLRKYK